MGLFSKSDKALTSAEIDRFVAHINELNDVDLKKLLDAVARLKKKKLKMSEQELENVTAGIPNFEGTDISGIQFTKSNELSEEQLERGALGSVPRDVGEEAFRDTFGDGGIQR